MVGTPISPIEPTPLVLNVHLSTTGAFFHSVSYVAMAARASGCASSSTQVG